MPQSNNMEDALQIEVPSYSPDGGIDNNRKLTVTASNRQLELKWSSALGTESRAIVSEEELAHIMGFFYEAFREVEAEDDEPEKPANLIQFP